MTTSINEQVMNLERWAILLAAYPDPAARLRFLEQELSQAPAFLQKQAAWWSRASLRQRLIALELLLLDQTALDLFRCTEADLDRWTEQLAETDAFYDRQGGCVGYQAQLLELLTCRATDQQPHFLQPSVIDLRDQNPELWRWVRQGLEALPQCAELYPIGGAGDRLGLKDPHTGECLPVALLQFDRKTLLQGLIDDLFAREWLYYRIFGQQITCPIAMMTSDEKGNATKIRAACEGMGWFGRGADLFNLFSQPLVPVIDQQGAWVILESGELLLKPGGHGVIWRLMQEKGVVDWLFQHHAHLLVVRQINNPLAASDRNLLALVGIGLDEGKVMGFASCPRLVGAAEGMNVVRVTLDPSGPKAALTNVEYTDFQRLGWRDEPTAEGSPYSAYPSNTNILYLNLQKALVELPELPVAGATLNLKPAQICEKRAEKRVVGRLESTMQNLADHLGSPLEAEIGQQTELPDLKAFCTCNDRLQVLSATKRAWNPGDPLLETPQGAYLDLLQQRLDVLQSAGWQVPVQKGSVPVALVSWHPALGPLHTIFIQRLQGGRLQPGAELVLNLAEAVCQGLEVDGSFHVEAHQPLGPMKEDRVCFGPACGQLLLQNVKVSNAGAVQNGPGWDYAACPPLHESCRIVLLGASRFTARGVHFKGPVHIEVSDGEWVEAISDDSPSGFQLIRRPWRGQDWLTQLLWEGNLPTVELLVSSVTSTEACAR